MVAKPPRLICNPTKKEIRLLLSFVSIQISLINELEKQFPVLKTVGSQNWKENEEHLKELVEKCQFLEGKNEWAEENFQRLEENLVETQEEVLKAQASFFNIKYGLGAHC